MAFRDENYEWGFMGLGTLILLGNAVLLGLYTFSCHSCRHVIGGRLRNFSANPIRYRVWTMVSRIKWQSWAVGRRCRCSPSPSPTSTCSCCRGAPSPTSASSDAASTRRAPHGARRVDCATVGLGEEADATRADEQTEDDQHDAPQ